MAIGCYKNVIFIYEFSCDSRTGLTSPLRTGLEIPRVPFFMERPITCLIYWIACRSVILKNEMQGK